MNYTVEIQKENLVVVIRMGEDASTVSLETATETAIKTEAAALAVRIEEREAEKAAKLAKQVELEPKSVDLAALFEGTKELTQKEIDDYKAAKEYLPVEGKEPVKEEVAPK